MLLKVIKGFFLVVFIFAASRPSLTVAQDVTPTATPTTTPTITNKKKVSLELALLVDVSGSVDNEEFELQKKGYADAFRSQKLIERVQQAGDIAVTLIYWSSSYEQQIAIPFKIVNETNILAFADEIDATTRPFGGGTDIGPAIRFAIPLFGQEFTSLKQVIDVSGDGESYAIETEEARDEALAAGIDAINGLPIIPEGDTSLLEFYTKYVIGGENPFAVASQTFEAFKEAAIEKIFREIEIIEQCPNDPTKLLPGVCGCGFADVDTNNNGQIDCLEDNFCGEKASIELKDGLKLSTESLAALGLLSAKELNKLIKPVADQHGEGRAVPLKRFANLSVSNIKKTEAAVKEILLKMPYIVKECPRTVVCASIDNTADKIALRDSIKTLFKLVKRATTRLFFVELVELPPSAGMSQEDSHKFLRAKVGKRRKEYKAVNNLLKLRTEEIPDLTQMCN